MPDIIVCGHLCIDLIPGMAHVTQADLVTPGHLSETGPLIVSTGGAVSNTGLALHRLGLDVGLMATVGDDLIGRMIVGYLEQRSPSLSQYIQRRPGQASSYTIVLSPENHDRTFLHCPGTNATFSAGNVDLELARAARLFHFGYPSIMPRMFEDEGRELATLLRDVHAAGVVTSLDTSLPDPAAPSGRAPWERILAAALPHVDVFVPSIEEILYMLWRDDYERWRGAVLAHLTLDYLRELAGDLLAMGVAVAGFKLGELGIYLRTSSDPAVIARLSRLPVDAAAWTDAEAYHPAFVVTVAGTTGAGDSAYAGLLASLLRGVGPAEAARRASAVGACNVEHPDSNSGVRPWDEVTARLDAGWPTLPGLA